MVQYIKETKSIYRLKGESMNIEKKIREYKKQEHSENNSIFLDLADTLINNFCYKIEEKSYLLVPDPRAELKEMSYEYLLENSKIMPIDLVMKINDINNKFIKLMQELGFTVIYDIKDYNFDGKLYDLMGSSSLKKGTLAEEDNNIKNVNVPLTLTVDEYSKNMFLPAVFKNVTANRGEDKYLIETNIQLEKILKLFELEESKKIFLKSQFVVQEYIKGLDNVNSSIRVFTSSQGDVLAALFIMTEKNKKVKKVKKFGIDIENPCEMLHNPDSPFYLNTQNIVSNYSAGGKVISLNEGKKLTQNEKITLWMHGIDVDSLLLPDEIVNDCKTIAEVFGTTKGMVLGIDFIYNAANKKWYYLETNRNPSVDGYRVYMGLRDYLKKDVKTLMHMDAIFKIVESVAIKNLETNKKL